MYNINTQLKSNLSDELRSQVSIIETAFFYANHACIIIDLLGPSLYEELKKNNFNGFSLRYIQKVFQSILPVLNALSSLQLIHCDVKPENILIYYKNRNILSQTSPENSNENSNNSDEVQKTSLSNSLILESPSKNDDISEFKTEFSTERKAQSYSCQLSFNSKADEGDKQNSKEPNNSNSQQTKETENNDHFYDNIGFKLIDFGSCLFVGDNQDYIQSRYYRAPEILLKLPYDSKIDIWSLGCLAVELMLGVPILPAQSELHLATLIEKTIGPFPRHMFENSPRSTQIFMPDGKVKPDTLLCEENGEDFATTFVPYFVKKKLNKIIMSYESHHPGNDVKDREIFVDLIQKMLIIDPDQRISALEAMSHPFLHMNFRS